MQIFSYLLSFYWALYNQWFTLFVRTLYVRSVGRLHLRLINSSKGQARAGLKVAVPPHSQILRVDFKKGNLIECSVFVVGNLLDNYCYLLVDMLTPAPHPGILVDCGDADSVLCNLHSSLVSYFGGGFANLRPEIDAALSIPHGSKAGVDLQGIVTTHHHWDHQGGNVRLQNLFADAIPIMAGRRDRVAGCTTHLTHGSVVTVGRLALRVMETPSHTRGSIMVYSEWTTPPFLFSGDTLLPGGGHGALFEGDMQDTYRAIVKTLATCAPSTLLFPGHEYTTTMISRVDRGMFTKNLRGFQEYVSTMARAFHARDRRILMPTVPMRLSAEAAYGPAFVYVRRHVGVARTIWARYIKTSAYAHWINSAVAAATCESEVVVSREKNSVQMPTDYLESSPEAVRLHLQRLQLQATVCPDHVLSFNPRSPVDPVGPSAQNQTRLLADVVGHGVTMTWSVEWERFLQLLSSAEFQPAAAELACLLPSMLHDHGPAPVMPGMDVLVDGPPFLMDASTMSECRPATSVQFAARGKIRGGADTALIMDTQVAILCGNPPCRSDLQRLAKMLCHPVPSRARGLRPQSLEVEHSQFLAAMTSVDADYRRLSFREAESFWWNLAGDKKVATWRHVASRLESLWEEGEPGLCLNFVASDHHPSNCRLCNNLLGFRGLQEPLPH
ncbi:MAG: uncharacterized protein KVP18_003220 [Porospora cf. gigantea A]|uniref:uncharacterized protein n=1 Tax=Porospora cf. gigantea A TaxID=2853593 RepID=UPI00355A7FDA|nr:MAG: hypothetical protein KVP18_003220 [Porospora cf. gigantea A]